jgi:ribosomal-protein-alanine N-acetyltransferase
VTAGLLPYASGVLAFETERLRARGYSLDDAEDAFVIYGDAEVMRHLLGAAPTASVEAQREWLVWVIAKYSAVPNGFGAWALEERATRRVIGTALLKPGPMVGAREDEGEIGWHLARDVWGRGYATEIGAALLKQGHDRLGIQRLIALIEPDNTRSAAVARRIGMRDLGKSTQYDGGHELCVWESLSPSAA